MLPWQSSFLTQAVLSLNDLIRSCGHPHPWLQSLSQVSGSFPPQKLSGSHDEWQSLYSRFPAHSCDKKVGSYLHYFSY